MLLKTKIKNNLFYIMLLLACMNFMRMGSTIILVLCLYFLSQCKFRMKMNNVAWLYVLLLLTTVITALFWYSIFEIIKVLNYCLCYIVGLNSYFNADEPETHVFKSLNAMYVGCLAYIILLFINDLDSDSMYRVLVDIWSNEYISVTLVAVISSIVLGYSMYLLFFTEKKKLKVLALLSLLVIILLNFKTATRTVFVLGLLMLILGWGLKFYNGASHKFGKYIVVTLAFCISILIVYGMDFLNLRSNIEGSYLWQRFENISDSGLRIEFFMEHWKNSLNHPFGGQKLSADVGKLAHNVTQDFYDNFGMLPTAFFILIFFFVIRNLFRLVKRRNQIKTEKVLIMLYVVILLQMSTEPIITGYPIFVWLLFMINGFTDAYFAKV